MLLGQNEAASTELSDNVSDNGSSIDSAGFPHTERIRKDFITEVNKHVFYHNKAPRYHQLGQCVRNIMTTINPNEDDPVASNAPSMAILLTLLFDVPSCVTYPYTDLQHVAQHRGYLQTSFCQPFKLGMCPSTSLREATVQSTTFTAPARWLASAACRRPGARLALSASLVPPREMYPYSELRRCGGCVPQGLPPPRAGEPRGRLQERGHKIRRCFGLRPATASGRRAPKSASAARSSTWSCPEAARA